MISLKRQSYYHKWQILKMQDTKQNKKLECALIYSYKGSRRLVPAFPNEYKLFKLRKKEPLCCIKMLIILSHVRKNTSF